MVELNNAFLSPQTHTAKQSNMCKSLLYESACVTERASQMKIPRFFVFIGENDWLKRHQPPEKLHQESLQDGHHLRWAKWRWNKASMLYMTNDLRVFQLTLLIITARLFQRRIPHLPQPTCCTNGATASTNTSRASIKSTLYFIFC